MGSKMGSQGMTAYLDTNIEVFLHSGNTQRLTQRALTSSKGQIFSFLQW